MIKCFCQNLTKEVFDMNKVKQIFKLSSFALLSCFMAASGVLLSTITPKTATADVVQESITNTLPVFFDNGDHTSEVYFDASSTSDTAAVVKFDFMAQKNRDVDFDNDGNPLTTDDVIHTSDTTPSVDYFPEDPEYGGITDSDPTQIYIYRYYPDGLDTSNHPINPYHYYYININSITLTLNGSELVYQTGEIYGTPNDFILASNAPSYFERTFYPESLDFQIELNTTASHEGYNASIEKRSEDVDIATLTLFEEGLLNVSIGYTLYDVTLTPAQPGATAPTETYTTLTGQQFDYSIFMFSSDTYFESSSSANPARVNYNANNTVRTPSESSSHSYNYFYNYSSRGTTTNELPYLTYDPFRYQLTLTKSLNNTTTSQTVVFNPETHEFEAPDFVYSMQFEQETGLMRIYFNDLGLYNLSFDMIYSYTTTSAAEGVTYHSYDLSPTVRDQKLYVYGAQMSYTDYETGSFAEFKTIENNSITQAADITRNLTATSTDSGALTPSSEPLATYFTENATPVVTDQTPVKLSTYGSNFEAMLYTKGDSGWSTGQSISTTRNLSDDDEYLLAVEYNFANYTNSSGTIASTETFYQYFYFKIEKTTPEVEVEKFVPNSTDLENPWANLASGQYTNQNVKITYSSDSSEFDADVFIYLSQYNFSDSLVRRQQIYPAIGSDWDMTNGELEIANSENGKYLLQIYYGRNALQQQPITRSFYIDTQPITGLQAFAVSSSSNRYFSDGALDSSAGKLYGTATNQAFAFGWENVKQSDAGTQGYVRYYPLENFDDYYTGSANTATLISDLLRDYDVLPTTMKLNLSTSPNWTEYSNASTFPSTSIGGECVESAAGLYVFQIFDDAGNSAAAYVFLDSSAPQFVLYEENVGYRLISNNETINSNATVYWSDAKAIMINVGDGDSFAYDNFGTHLLQNHMQSDTETDEQLLALFNAFVGGASATNIENLNLTTATDRNGTYYIVDILDQIAFAERSPENLELRTFETNSYDIEFSFSIHYTQDATSGSTVFYKSTTRQNVYENMQTGEDVLASDGKIDYNPLNDADIYQTLSQSGERTFYYGTQGSMTLTNLTTGESVTMTIRDGTNYIGLLQATAVEFVDMEGSYSFLIRDTSNTTGRNAVSELVRFSSYPSASQYITVSADTSSVQVNYNEGDTSNQLFLASYYSTNGTGTDSTRQSYYTPTSYEGVLNISFKPTVDTTQIDTLTLEYYPYETRFVANRAANGYVQLSFYRTLAAQPSLPNTIYSFDQNGAAASNETRTYQVNVPDTMTAEGKYVLTRTYMTGEGYTINNFDYATRELTFYVDRNNVITETSTVMADAQTYTLVGTDGTTPSPYTLTIYGNLYVIEATDGSGLSSHTASFAGTNKPEDAYYNNSNHWNMGNYSYYIMPEDFVFESLSITVGGVTYTTAGVRPDASSLSTMESVVGGDIFVNMYDAQPGDSGSILSVTFPNTTLTDGITLGSGETFFTDDRESWENITPSPILQTNKLPVKVYIPEFKYTIFNSETYNNEDASVSYESNENPLLSYYDQNAQAISQIAAYRLSAVITDSHGATYASNGVDENGYLTFVSTADGSTLTELSQEGTYTVEITQNATGSGAGTANDFKKSYKFAFNITQSSPEFELSTVGRALETLGDENYYTNQKTFTATWVDQNSPYIANIDKAHILLEFSKNYPKMIVDVSNETPSVVLAEDLTTTTAQTELVQRALEYQISGYNNTLTLNFEDAGIYNQKAWVQVTMQFVGHNAEYYEVTTKTVTIDKIASYDSLDTLIANVSPFSNGTVTFNETTLRNYFNVEGTPVRGKTEAAYNTSVSSGNLQYYSYLVDNAFLQSLASAAAENNTYSHADRTIRVYYRAIGDPYGGTYIETSYDNFTPTNFTELEPDGLEAGHYYEIVEQDLAGNLTIYLVYLYSENTDDGFAATVDEYGNITDEDGSEVDTTALQGIQFIDGDRFVQISDAQILAQQASGRVVEMFSSKNFSLEKLNLRGDAWLTLTVSQANTTARSYLFSPWLAESQMVIDMQSGQTVSFDQIFAEFVSSSSSSLEINLQISNRAQGGTLQAALNLANGASLTANYSSSQTEEYLSIRRSDLVYPVSVKINLGNEEEPYYYNVSNDPNALENLQNSSYSYLNSWTNDRVSFSYDFERLWFKFVTLPASNTKVRYEIKDNFGNVTTLIHIFGETYFEPVTSSGNRYQDLISNPDMNDDSEDFFTVYVSGDDVIYHYNSSIYAVYVTYWDGSSWTIAREGTDYTSTDSGNITSLTFSRGDAAQIDRWFRIYVDEIPDDATDYEITDVGVLTNRVDNIFIHLYEMRPELDVPRDEGVAEPDYLLTFRDHYGENVTGDILTDDETYETVTVGGRDYRVTSQGSTFALNLTVDYTDPSSLDYPYEVLCYNAATMSSFENLPSRTTINESGIYYFLVRYAQNANGVLANEYDLYKIEILDSASEFYRVTNNGVLVERAPSYYTYDDTQYSDYYIVNVNYNQDSASVQIVPNDYQQISASSVETIPEGNGVVTVQYLVTNYAISDDGVPTNPPTTPGVSAFNRYVFVTFIPPTSNPVPSAVYYFNQNEQFDMLSSSSISAVVPRENTSQDTVTIRWTSSYGISSNYVYINVLKDGTAFFNSEDMTAASQALVSYRTNGDFNYITLNRSGTYTISFSDEAGNQQAFASNVRALRFVFLKDVAFSMTYTDASTGEQIVSDPIQKGVFNGSVGLTILNMSDYYTAASTGSGEGMIRASRNGATYSGYTYDATSHTFTFSEPGYYSVSFVATSISGVEVREQTYNFTIVNPNESRYSFEFAPYQDYYITSVVKDNLGDISGDIIANMQSYGINLQTISIDGQTYLRELVTSYIGLGSGRYTVTIATRSSYNRENYSEPTEMTFSYWINTASVPIDISLQEGASTSSPITVSFNAERIYQAVGECMVTIGLNTYYITGENASSFGVVNAPPIEASGTYFITVRSMSGNLLFSYKVIKTEPLNGWAIAAIVIGCVVAIAAVIIIVKLRKRIKVK